MIIDAEPSAVVQRVAETVSHEKCILFLGAGVHAPAPEGGPRAYDESEAPPRGVVLSERLARGCGLAERLPDEDPRNLQRVSLFYEIEHSRHRLIDEIARSVQVGRSPSPMLRALAELNFPLVITTNYDQLFETALAATGKRPRVSVYTPELEATVDYRDPTAQSPVLFKIHGDIARPETVVVTDEDYIQFALRMSSKDPYDPIPLTLKYFLTGWTTLFVGYSLLDYNLRLLFKTLRWKVDSASVPEMYSVDMHPDPLIFDIWHNQRRYVKFIAQDVWAFVPALYRLVLDRDIPGLGG